MIIDHHNHIWEGESTGGFLDEGMSVKRILKEMDQAGVDVALSLIHISEPTRPY